MLRKADIFAILLYVIVSYLTLQKSDILKGFDKE